MQSNFKFESASYDTRCATALITTLGGTITEDKKIGMKKFAYRINFQYEGFYVVTTFDIEGDKIAEIERQLGITDGVVRHMVVRK